MRKAACAFILCSICLHSISFSQKKINEAPLRNSIREVNSNVSRNSFSAHSPSTSNVAPPGDRLSMAQLLTPDSLKIFLKNHSAKSSFSGMLSNRLSERKQDSYSCIDTSFVRLFNTYASWIFVENITSLSDGGILISALLYDTTKGINFTWRNYALLLKIDESGNISWIKQFDNADPVTFSTFYMYNAFELSNKDIIGVGSIDTTSGLSQKNNIVYRLNKDGNIIWHTDLHSALYPQDGNYEIFIKSIAEGFNNDLILCGTSFSNSSAGIFETIIRMDNLGNVIWDANYGNYGPYLFGAEGIAVYMVNGQLVEIGLSHGTDYPQTVPALNILNLDYNTGNIKSKRFFRTNYIDPNQAFSKTFIPFRSKCTRLNNGHFLLSGQLFSDYVNVPVTDHFGIIEFDENFNLLKANTISSSQHTNYGSDIIQIDETGKGALALFEYIDPYNANIYFGAFEGDRFLNQRKVQYNGVGLPGLNGITFLKDSSYVLSQSYFKGGTESFIEYRKMHIGDSSSDCMGKDTFFLQFLPLQLIEDPSYFYLDANIPGKVQVLHYNLSQNDTLKVITTDPCKQINHCDTIKIHGNPFICGSQSSILFTAYKNTACGGIVQWNIDNSAIDSLQIQTDTSILVHFKNINWQGQIFASLSAGSCKLPVSDSLAIGIIRLQNAINLGPDTILCRGNKLVLHAGSTFNTYKWQDGSTDSIFNVSSPGKYYVSASDQCGNNFSDTILINGASFPFSIGNDTLRCNKDSIRLTASGGFSNYQWQPLYNMSADTGKTIKVLPLVDTFYIATAQKQPGCFVSDTIHISVLASPGINLGNDTSFCNGQFLSLNAGTGFSSYAWSTGAVSQQINVSQVGAYIVKATAPNGCISSDTLQIINVASLPVFSLGADTALCNTKTLSYNFNLPGAVYLWSDGSTGSQYAISRPGTYSVAVTQQGCTARDTIVVNYKNNPTVFLGNDTAICAGNTLLLEAAYNNASYLWQDGSALPDFIVSSAGVYFVTVNLFECVTKDTIQVAYLDKPVFTLGKDTVICQGQSIVLRPHLNIAANYLWQDGSTQPEIIVKETGLYRLQASNVCGSFSDDIVLTQGLCTLMLPNAFTPNRDGLNDVFSVKYPFPVKGFLLSVYNRFGEKVFETTDMMKGWDGTYKALDQPVGVYTWIVHLQGMDNKEQFGKGIITLLK